MLREPDHPLAQLRIAWIMTNESLDAEQEARDRRDLAEYQAWFWNADAVVQLRKDREAREAAPKTGEAAPRPAPTSTTRGTGAFKVVEVYDHWWNQYYEAMKGVPIEAVSPEELAELELLRSGAVPVSSVQTKPFVPKPDPAMLDELRAMGVDLTVRDVIDTAKASLPRGTVGDGQDEQEGLVDPSTIDWDDPDDPKR